MVGNGIITLHDPIELHYTVKVKRVQLFERRGQDSRICTLCLEVIPKGSQWGHLILDSQPTQHRPACHRCLQKMGVVW
jgi:hypothetical protein